MTPGQKTAVVVGVAGVATVVIVGIFEHFAHAAPNAPCKCPDGTPCPGGDPSKCPPPGQLGQNDPDSPPGGWNYTGNVSSNVQQAMQALAAVNPCDCANVGVVRAAERAAGLTVNGQTDGRYGGDLFKVAGQYVPNPPQPCYSNSNPNRPSWWGAPGTYTNPLCPGDPGPNA
jgi:hypothetical protein